MNKQPNWFIRFFGPNIVIVVLYFFLLLGLFHFYGVKFKLDHYKLWSILLTSLFVIYVSTTFYQRLRHKEHADTPFLIFIGKTFLRFVRDWFPLVALVTIYENLREYTGIIRTDQIDSILYKMDVAIFGVEPTLWIQQFEHPILTEYLAFTYSIYFVMPLTLGWVLYLLNKRREFHELMSAFSICMCVGFLMFLAFPAGPPRFFITELFDPPTLQGYWGYYNSLQAKFDGLNPMTYRASFPSLHVAFSTFAMYYSIKFRHLIPFGRVLQVIYSIFVISLWISTVYLRHHWVVDIFAGWAVNAVAIYGAYILQKKWPYPS